MPHGKPAGVPCIQLDTTFGCRLFTHPTRPAVCAGLQPSFDMCGPHREHALHWLGQLEALTAPSCAALMAQ